MVGYETAAVITLAGKLGVSTTSPLAKLDVVGTISALRCGANRSQQPHRWGAALQQRQCRGLQQPVLRRPARHWQWRSCRPDRLGNDQPHCHLRDGLSRSRRAASTPGGFNPQTGFVTREQHRADQQNAVLCTEERGRVSVLRTGSGASDIASWCEGHVVIDSHYGALIGGAPTDGLLVEGTVGIGWVTPTIALEASETISATNFVGNGSGLTGVTAAAAGVPGSIKIILTGALAGRSDIIVSDSGYVSIGTATPNAKLEVRGVARGATTYGFAISNLTDLDNSLGANQFVGRRGDTGWDVPEAIIVGGRGTTASGNAGGGNWRRHHQRASQPRTSPGTSATAVSSPTSPRQPGADRVRLDSLRRLSLNYVGLIAPIVKAMQKPKADIANLRDEVEADARP
jgi:hypothetical protein